MRYLSINIATDSSKIWVESAEVDSYEDAEKKLERPETVYILNKQEVTNLVQEFWEHASKEREEV